MPIDPSDFSRNDAWLLFQLNDAPVQTMTDGDFHAMAIMEVSTGMSFGMEMMDVGDSEMSETQSRKLLTTSGKQAGSLPRRLFVASLAQLRYSARIASIGSSAAAWRAG